MRSKVRSATYRVLKKLPKPVIVVLDKGARATNYLLLRFTNLLPVIKRSYLNEEITLTVADRSTVSWYGADWTYSDRREFQELERLRIPADGLVFNIGAHHGLVAMLLKKKLVPRGRVIAVEMDYLNAAASKRNISINKVGGIDVLHVAISENRSPVVSSGTTNAQIVTAKERRYLQSAVEATTLDDLVAKFGVPDLVYLDIEGAEVATLRGAPNAIGRVPHWFIELHGDEECAKFGGTNRSVAQALHGCNYKLWFAANETEAMDPVELAQISSGRGFLLAILSDRNYSLYFTRTSASSRAKRSARPSTRAIGIT